MTETTAPGHDGHLARSGWTCSCGWAPAAGVRNTFAAFQQHKAAMRRRARTEKAQARSQRYVDSVRDEFIRDVLGEHAPTTPSED